MIRSSVDFPEPLGPRSAVSDPLVDVERDVVDGDEVAEALRDVADENRTSSAVSSLRV